MLLQGLAGGTYSRQEACEGDAGGALGAGVVKGVLGGWEGGGKVNQAIGLLQTGGKPILKRLVRCVRQDARVPPPPPITLGSPLTRRPTAGSPLPPAAAPLWPRNFLLPFAPTPPPTHPPGCHR